MSLPIVLVGSDGIHEVAGAAQLWTEVHRAGWLSDDMPLLVWQSRTCSTPELEPLLAGLEATLLDGGTQTGASLASGVRVESPLLADGTPLPTLWLEPARLIVVCELGIDPRWGMRGAMAAQAEPLQLVGDYPWFSWPRVVCEAQRLGAADLVLMRDSGRWLVAPSALLLDLAVAGAAGPVPRLWARHWSLPNAPRLSAAASVKGAPGAATAARLLVTASDVRSDAARAWTNRYRVDRFVRRRLLGAEV